MFKRSEACILLVIISLIKKSNLHDSYGDNEDQMRDYYDSVYERSFTKEKPSREAEPSNFIGLKMPGIHPEKVGKLYLLLCFKSKAFGTLCPCLG